MRLAVLLVACGAPAPELPHATIAPPRHVAQPDPALEFGAPHPQCESVRFTRLRVDECYCRHQPRNLAGERCADVFYHRDLRGLLAPRLDAPTIIKSGARVNVHLVFHNASPDPLPLVTGGYVKLEVHDRTGADVTYAGTCRSGYSASGEHDLLTLAGGGDLDLELSWLAAARDECSGRDLPYPPGRYTIVVGTGLVEDAPVATVSAIVEVR